MEYAEYAECAALIIAALVLIIVLVASFMCIQLYHIRKPPSKCDSGSSATKDRFLGSFYYTPTCGSSWLSRRRQDCRGLSNGNMPSIDAGYDGFPSCGSYVGVPP